MTDPELGNAIHPRIIAEQEQIASQEVIENLQITAELWELRIADAKERKLSTTEIHDLSREAVQDMDRRWDYGGERFLIAGTWIYKKIQFNSEESETPGALVHSDGATWSDEEEDVFLLTYSLGWGIKNIEGKSRLCYMFNARTVIVQDPDFHLNYMPLAYALPEAISLTLLPAETAEQSEVQTERVYQTLELYDRLVYLCMAQPGFHQQSRKKQAACINDLVNKANELITNPGSVVYAQCKISEWYERTETSTGYGFQRIDALDNEKGEAVEVNGSILGVAVLEQDVLNERPLRIESDYIDHTAGLCIMLEVYDNGEPEIRYVPYWSAGLEPDKIEAYPA